MRLMLVLWYAGWLDVRSECLPEALKRQSTVYLRTTSNYSTSASCAQSRTSGSHCVQPPP